MENLNVDWDVVVLVGLVVVVIMVVVDVVVVVQVVDEVLVVVSVVVVKGSAGVRGMIITGLAVSPLTHLPETRFPASRRRITKNTCFICNEEMSGAEAADAPPELQRSTRLRHYQN